MAVLKGEGRVLILFGSLPLPIPPNRSAYIARPDLGGSYVTAIVACDTDGITPSIKALARHLARFGYAAIVTPLREDFDRAVADLTDAVDSARIPGTAWADGDRVGIIALGSAAAPACVVAAEEDVSVLALVDGSLDADLLAGFEGRLLVMHGADDEVTPADEVRTMRQEIGRGEWVLYTGVGGGFFDDASESHDPGAAADVLDRLVATLDARFGAVPAA